jgi:type I restriction enzyme M protein
MINIRKLESELWESADLLRQGSKLSSQEYCMPVRGGLAGGFASR